MGTVALTVAAIVYVIGVIAFMIFVIKMGIDLNWKAGRIIHAMLHCFGWPAVLIYVLWEGRWK